MIKSFEGFFNKKVKPVASTRPDPMEELEKWVRSNDDFQKIQLVNNNIRGVTIEFNYRGEKIILFDPYFSTISGRLELSNISLVINDKFIGRITSINLLLTSIDWTVRSQKRERQGIKFESDFKKELDIDYLKDLLVDLFDLDLVGEIKYEDLVGDGVHHCFWVININLSLVGDHPNYLILYSKEIEKVINSLSLIKNFIDRVESEGYESRYNVDSQCIIIERQYDYKKDEI